MENCQWTVYLDEEAQLVIQRIEGEMDEAGFGALTKEIERCVARLRNPADLRFLVDGRRLGKTNARTRMLSIKTFRERNVNRMAVWGCNPFIRVLIRFMSVAEGNGRIRAFAREEEARAWLAG
ncbi:MAG: STAS/SEC14 domain-containing protein [Chitinispirillaceae bacterium]|nr:STAS/SEC14 domain-containing protein [Chitinispirillaceae bacterium]